MVDQEHAGERFPDEAIVVRGGAMNPPFVLKSAAKHAKGHDGEHAISVRCRTDLNEAELIAKLPGNYPVCMVSTVGAVRRMVCEVVASEREPGDAHADLIFPSEPTDEDVRALKKVFVRTTIEE